jgi:GNAT superfamily N-acetyltransferase
MKVGSKPWKVAGWLLRPVQFAVGAGLAAVLLSYVFDWAHGWGLVWSFAGATGGVLAVEGLERLWWRWSYSREKRAERAWRVAEGSERSDP